MKAGLETLAAPPLLARHDLLIRQAQIAGLRLQIPYAVWAQVVAAMVMVWLVSGQAPSSRLWSWVGWFSCVYLFGAIWSYRITDPSRIASRDADRVLQVYCLITALRASPWGLACWLLVPGTLQDQMALLVIVFALLTGVPTTLGSHFPAVLCFALPLLLPSVVRLLTLGNPLATALGVGSLVFLPLYLGAIRRANQTVVESYRLRFRNEALLDERKDQAQAQARAMEDARRGLAVAERASQDKTRFLAAASHDLRQPVHAIGLFVAALKAERLSGRPEYLVDRLDRSLAGLDDLFNRLLDISRLDAGVMAPRYKTFGLSPIASTLETRFGHLANSKNLRFKVVCARGLFSRSDPTLLIELLMNLLSNAFRYTEAGGVLLCMRRRGERIAIQVWDTGCGIAEKNLESIFDEFVQVDNPSRDRRRGLGLGLAIVRRIAGILDHPLRVRSSIGRGSMFEVNVPRVIDPPSVDALDNVERSRDAELGGTLVLVVDDEIDILAAMEAVLSSWGCFAILARSGAEAVAYINASPRFPDVMISDHRLSGHETSFDVAELVCASLPYEIPMVVVSGEPGTSLERQVQDRGWQFINKPVSPAALRAALTVAMGGATVSVPQ